MTGMTFPIYIGAMIVAAVMRNLSEYTGKFPIYMGEINGIGGISLSMFLGLAMITLKLWQLAELAVPMLLLRKHTNSVFYYNTKTGACASAKCTKRLPLPELHVTVHSRYLSLLKNPRFFFSLCGASPLLTRSAACKLSSVASSNLRSSSFASAERCSGVCTTKVT